VKPLTAAPDCEEIVARLWPHLDGALPESERARVVAHLERCTGCRSHFDFAQAFLDAVHRSSEPVDDFAAIRDRVSRAIAAERERLADH
jgi:anti-sigma factor (TIGR02949 family)